VDSSADLGFLNAGDTVKVRFVYGGDTNTKGPNTPSWEITSVKVTDGNAPSTVTFNFAALAVVPGNANPPVFYQWYRDGNIIPGANGTSYTLSPRLNDNGAKFSCTAYTLGANVASREATLTVAQPNTPPTFACGPNQAVAEDAGAQTVAGWATDIKNNSIARVPTVFASDFNSLPAGTRLIDLNGAGTRPDPRLEDGVLKLTDALDAGGFGGWAIGPFPVALYESLNVSWKSRVGGGGGGGADGYSLNIGTDLSDSFTAEEGTGTGLSVTVDTFDNGTGQDVGIDIKWQGARVGYIPLPKDDDGSGNYLRKDTFGPDASSRSTSKSLRLARPPSTTTAPPC
jgi:hypothetical protein